MEWRQLQQARNERCAQRHELSIERLQAIGDEETVQESYRLYFAKCADHLLKLEEIRRKIAIHGIEGLPEEELQQWNQEVVRRGSGGKLSYEFCKSGVCTGETFRALRAAPEFFICGAAQWDSICL